MHRGQLRGVDAVQFLDRADAGEALGDEGNVARPLLRQGPELIALASPFGEDGVVGRAGESLGDYHGMSSPGAAAGAAPSLGGPKLTLSATMSVV